MMLYLVVLVGVSGISGIVGYRMAEYQGQQAVIEASRMATEKANEQIAIDAEILSASAQKQADIQVKQRVIIKEVVRYVASHPDYSSCKLDARGLCLAQSAARGESGENCAE